MSIPRLKFGVALYCASLCITTLCGQSALNAQTTDSDIPRDTLKGRWMLWETSPVIPPAVASDGRTLYTFNQQGCRVLRMDVITRSITSAVPAGPGLVAVVLRPGSDELWCVDQVTSTVMVISTSTEMRVLHTIQVGAEPAGLVFSANGDRAFVTCAAVDRVDVVDADAKEVAASISIPARRPRAIARIGDRIYVAPMLSGNGTAPRGSTSTTTNDVIQVRHVDELPGTNSLPDRDLFAIDISGAIGTEALDEPWTLSGLGTTLYAAIHRPGTTELWIPGSDSFNGSFAGQESFIEGRLNQNQIAIVNVATRAVQILDLDTLTDSAAVRCATPTSVAFSADGMRAFVVGYGSDSLTELSLTAADPVLVGTIRMPPVSGYPDGSGPRLATIMGDDHWLITLNKGENTWSRINMTSLPSTLGYDYEAPKSITLGWDPLPPDLNQGRIHFRRTQNSLAGTSSCDTCHVDGHTDNLAWDLSCILDPEGTPLDQIQFPLDGKGPMVTQTVRHLREVGPWHWRGEKKMLSDFNGTFIELLEREEEGESAHLGPDFLYVVQYMEHLAVFPNPGQNADRSYTPDQLEGADLFLNHPVKDGLSCMDCHTLPLGARGDILPNHLGGLAPSTVVPPLRGVHDKRSTPFTVGGDFGKRTELGIGYGHSGASPTIQDVLLALQQDGTPQFNLTPWQANKITDFVESLDTGIAPAAAWQGTATPLNALTFLNNELAAMIVQANLGNCDLVYRHGPEDFHGMSVYMTGWYDPATGTFRQASQELPNLSDIELVHIAAVNRPVTFLGVPPLMGQPLGIDRDNDGILDLDEHLLGTDWENTDTDGDTFPDGYELKWRMDPLVEDQRCPDNDPPQLLAPVDIKYVTGTAVKFELVFNEPTRILVSKNGGTPVLRAPLKPKHDTHVSIILGELLPGTDYSIDLNLSDPNGNETNISFPIHTLDRVEGEPVHINQLRLRVLETGGVTQRRLKAIVRLGRDGGGSPDVGYSLTASVYHRDFQDQLTLVTDHAQTWLTNDKGLVVFYIPIPDALHVGSDQLYFALHTISAPPGRPPYVEGDDMMSHDMIEY